MPVLPVTSLATALLGLLLFALSWRVIAVRRSGRVSLGSGGNPQLEKRIRAHANFCEYVPFCLALLALLEANAAAAAPVLQGGAALLVLARLSHPLGIEGAGMAFRMFGMIGTFTVLIAGSAMLLVHALGAM